MNSHTFRKFGSLLSHMRQSAPRVYQCQNSNWYELYAHCGSFCFSVIKVDGSTGKRLPGATFSLTSHNGYITSKTTNENGVAYFYIEPCVHYQISETIAPCGYQLTNRPINVFIDGCDRIFINGCRVSGYCVVVPNQPVKNCYGFTVKKADGNTRAAVSGAVFNLLLNDIVIDTAISQQNGDLTFSGLLPGRYHLLELIPPPGYQNNSTRYEVVITDTGEVTIHGYPAQGFVITNIPGFRLSFIKVAITCDE